MNDLGGRNMPTRSIDISSDVGEGFAQYTFGNDEEIMKYISSANVACGFHAGDPGIMRRTVSLAKKSKVAVGAHVGLPDLLGFGRRVMEISPEECRDYVVYQIGALKAFTEANNMNLQHLNYAPPLEPASSQGSDHETNIQSHLQMQYL